MRAERVEAGVLQRSAGPHWLPTKGGVRRGDGGHRGRSLGLEVARVGLDLGCPDGSKQAGHGGETAGTREVWLWGRKRGKTLSGGVDSF